MADNKQMESLTEMFFFEANQLTEQLENILLESEAKQNISPENINEIFRIMHTLKGSAAMMSYNDISKVAHTLEDLFFIIREDKPEIDVSAICDLVFKGLDFIRYQIEILENGGEVQDGQQDAVTLTEMIKSYITVFKGKDNNKPLEETPQSPVISNPTGNSSSHSQYKATVFFEDYCSMVNVRAYMVANKLSEFCQEITYFPEQLTSDDKVVGYILDNGFELHFSSDLDLHEIRDIIQDIMDVKTAVVQLLSQGNKKEAENKVEAKNVQQPGALKDAAAASAQVVHAEKEESKQSTKQNIISVNIHKLDKLIDIVGELVISESMVTKSPDLAGLNLESFSKASRQLRKLTDELQDLVLSIRMIPIEMSFSKMHRIVRDMSKKLNKEVTLEIIGESTEVDKNVIDYLSDPLMHLIRNCMDHGIESKEERIKSNKNPVGKITLEAKNTGGDVIITVADDGKGLDKQKILNKARESGLLTKNENPSDKEIYNYILLPGFSTKEEITEFSGRGVGMDVVKRNIEQVRGSISVDSEQGKGTVFTIKIPLTLAIIDGMLVQVGDQVYIIPTQSIIQSFRPAKGSVFSDTEGRDMIIIRGNCYAVVKLHTLFNVETQADYSDGIIIMTEYNDKVICLYADNLLGQQPIVVKSLPDYLARFRIKDSGVGGCTILGDGSISLILDISQVVNYNL